MADTTYAASNLTATWLARKAHMLISRMTDLRQNVWRMDTSGMRGSLSVQVPQIQLNDKMSAPGESAATTPTALTDAKVTVTAARQTLSYRPTDEHRMANTAAGPMTYAEGISSAYVRRVDELICLAGDGFSASAGTSGAVMDVDSFHDAFYTLDQAGGTGMPTWVSKKKAKNEFQNSLRGEGGAVQFQAETANALRFNPSERWGSYLGINLVTSDQINDDGTDDLSFMMHQEAIALLEMPIGVLRQVLAEISSLSNMPSDAFVAIEVSHADGATLYEGTGFAGCLINEDALGVTIKSAT